MTEQEMDVERRKYRRQIIETANELQNTAQALALKAPTLGLTAEAEKAYLNLSDKLMFYAQTLRQQAEHQVFRHMPGTLHDMKATCTACHTLFRTQ